MATTKKTYGPLPVAMFKTTRRFGRFIAANKKPAPKVDAGAEQMAKLIRESDFGCQKLNVARLMEIATGKPVVEAFNANSKVKNGLMVPHDFAGAVVVLTKSIDGFEAGDVGLVWSSHATHLRMHGIRDIDYTLDSVRPATMDEVIAYIKKDKNYVVGHAEEYGAETDVLGF